MSFWICFLRSAFFWFCQDTRGEIRVDHPTWGVGDVAKELGKRWNLLTEEQKGLFEKKAEEDKARYEKVPLSLIYFPLLVQLNSYRHTDVDLNLHFLYKKEKVLYTGFLLYTGLSRQVGASFRDANGLNGSSVLHF